MKLEKIKREVENLYKNRHPNADPWIVWAYPNHVLVVANNAEKIATKQEANKEFCVAGALLHDIADTVMTRSAKEHENESLRMANAVLRKSGYSNEESTFIVNEIISPHSCSHILPTTLEGKVLATADAMAHFQTDFFLYFSWQHLGGKDLQSFKQWVLTKIEKHFHKKIFFEDCRTEVEAEYKAIKLLFSK